MHKTTSRNFREFNFRSSGIIRFHDIFVIWGFFKELLVWASAFNLNIILTYICKRNYSTFKNEEQFRAHKVVNIRIWCTGYKSSIAHFVQATYDLLFIRKIISWQCEIEWNIVLRDRQAGGYDFCKPAGVISSKGAKPRGMKLLPRVSKIICLPAWRSRNSIAIWGY